MSCYYLLSVYVCLHEMTKLIMKKKSAIRQMRMVQIFKRITMEL